MPSRTLAVLLTLLFSVAAPTRAAVVINEIFYHAPEDLDELQWVELHNTGDAAVDLAGWSIKELAYTFPKETQIAAGGEGGVLREGVAEGFVEFPAGEVDGLVGGVVELEPLEVVEVLGGVVEDLVDDDGAGGVGGQGGEEREDEGEEPGRRSHRRTPLTG